MSGSYLAFGSDHTEDEETPDCREHNTDFEVEEGPELISISTDWSVSKLSRSTGYIRGMTNGRKNVKGRWTSQKRKKASIPALVMPMDAGIVFGMSV